MNVLKKNVRLIVGIIIGVILVSGISVYATATYLYNASEVKYNDQKSVADALNDLYGNLKRSYTISEGSQNLGIDWNITEKNIVEFNSFEGKKSVDFSCNSRSLGKYIKIDVIINGTTIQSITESGTYQFDLTQYPSESNFIIKGALSTTAWNVSFDYSVVINE